MKIKSFYLLLFFSSYLICMKPVASIADIEHVEGALEAAHEAKARGQLDTYLSRMPAEMHERILLLLDQERFFSWLSQDRTLFGLVDRGLKGKSLVDLSKVEKLEVLKTVLSYLIEKNKNKNELYSAFIDDSLSFENFNSIADSPEDMKNLISFIVKKTEKPGMTNVYYARKAINLALIIDAPGALSWLSELVASHNETAVKFLMYLFNEAYKEQDAVEKIHKILSLGIPADGIKIGGERVSGTTPFIESTQNIAVMKVLLVHGADINAQDDEGFTALMRAAIENDVPAVEFLLDHHANSNIRAKNGQTALSLTKDAGIRYLLRNYEISKSGYKFKHV